MKTIEMIPEFWQSLINFKKTQRYVFKEKTKSFTIMLMLGTA